MNQEVNSTTMRLNATSDNTPTYNSPVGRLAYGQISQSGGFFQPLCWGVPVKQAGSVIARLCLFVMLLGSGIAAQAADVYFAPGGTGAGTSWSDAANFTTYTNTNANLTPAAGTRWFLKAGAYSYANANAINLLNDNLLVQGGFPASATGTDISGYNPVTNVTTITITGLSGRSIPMFSIQNSAIGAPHTFELKGFQVTQTAGSNGLSFITSANAANSPVAKNFTDMTFYGFLNSVCFFNAVSGTATYTNCYFHDNTSPNNGAAINNASSSNTFNPLTITGSVFTNNSVTGASNGGGAIQSQANVTITNSSFCANSATGTSNGGQGGALFTGNGGNIVTWTISGSTFSDNFTGGCDGGAIFIGKGKLVATNDKFYNNYTNGATSGCQSGGGAIAIWFAVDAGTSTITNSDFYRNHSLFTGSFVSQQGATRGGGAIGLMGTVMKMAISNSRFVENYTNLTSEAGGAIMQESTGSANTGGFFTIDGSYFKNNQINNSGGAAMTGSSTANGADIAEWDNDAVAGTSLDGIAYDVSNSFMQGASAASYVSIETPATTANFNFTTGNTFGNTTNDGGLGTPIYSCPVAITASTDLQIEKVGVSSVSSGSAVSYTLVVTNNGLLAADGTTVKDPVVTNFTATGVSCLSATGAGCPTSPTVAGLQGTGLVIPTFNPGASLTLVVTGTAGASGTITNVASVSAPSGMTDSNPANNSSTAVTSITTPVTLTNVCPASTVDLTTSLTSTPPVGTTVTWHTGTPATAANQIANPTSITASGTYYAAYFNTTLSCYGETVPVSVSIVPCNADLAIVKTGPASVSAGGAVSYTLVVTNSGPSPANGATIKDPVATNFTATGVTCIGTSGSAVCPASPTVATLQGTGLIVPTLPSGGSLTVVVTGTAGTSGTITNIASVSAPAGITDTNPANNSSTAVTPITPVADLAITKVGTSTALVGGTVTYTLVVTNSGPSAANGATVTDPSVANLSASSVVCSGASGGAVCPSPTVASLQSGLTIATLPSGGSLTLVVTGTATGTPQITNVASVTTPAGTTDSNPLNNSATAVTGVGTPTTDLAIVKTGSTTAIAGGAVSYTLVISNNGPTAASGATVSDPSVANLTVAGVSCVATTGGATCPPTTVASLQAGTISIPNFPANSSVTLEITGTAGSSGTITNIASVSAPAGVIDSNPANNSSTAVTPITSGADLAITKTGSVTAIAGGAVTYTLVVTNNGPLAANGSTVSDPSVANLSVSSVACSGATGGAVCPASPSVSSLQAGTLAIPTLPSGGSVTLVITGTASATGVITNVASVTTPAGITDTNPANNSSTAVTAIGVPYTDLAIVKSGPVTVGANGSITYTLTISNNGPSAANGATISDPSVANLSVSNVVCSNAAGGAVCPVSPTVSALQSGTLTIPTFPSGGVVVLTVTGTAGSAGNITNTATVTTPTGVTDNNPNNNTSTVVTAIQPPVSATNICPSSTVDLTTLINVTPPTGTTITWHTGTPATAANQISNPTSISVSGTYYAAFYDAANSCYSGTAQAIVTINPCNADLAITKTGSTSTTAGSPVTYTLVVTNNGPTAANGATVTDPSVANFTATAVSCVGSTGGAVCPSPTVASLQSGLTIATFPSGGSLTLVVTGTAGASGTIVNVASVATPPGVTDTNPANNSSTAVTPIGQNCPTPIARAMVSLCNNETLNLATYVPAGGSFTVLTGTAGSLVGSTFNGIASGAGVYKVGYWASGVAMTCPPDTITVLVRDCTPPSCNYPVNSIVVDANCGTSDGRAVVTLGGIPTNATTSFAWSTGQTGSTITGLAAGVYSVTATVTDGANICTVVDSIQVNNIGGPVAELKLVTAANCTTNGAASLSIVSGAGPFTVSWSGTASGTLSNVSLGAVTITNLPAGPYVFQISSAASPNCFGYLSVNIPRNDAAKISLTATPTSATACGSASGSITVNVSPAVGVTGPFSFSLNGLLIGSSSLPTYTFSNLPGGVYTVSVSSAGGCTTAEVPVTITETGAPAIAGWSSVNPACPTDQGKLVFAGGQSGTTFQVREATTGALLSTVNGASSTTLVLSAGTYVIQSTSGTCTSVQTLTITRPQDIDFNVQYKAETCASGGVGNSDGSLSVVQISGGTKPYTIVVTNSQSQTIANANLSSLPAGNYSVNVTDANGCSGSQGTLVTVPPCSLKCPALTFNTSVVDAQCGQSNGSAIAQLLNAPAGAAFTYAWSNGQNGPSITGLASGVYSVTAILTTTGVYSGCRYVDSVNVNAIGGPIFTVAPLSPASCTAANGTAIANILSGTGPFTIAWTGPTSGSVSAPNVAGITITGLRAGDYVFTITGSTSACQGVFEVTIPSSPGNLTATATATNVTSCGASDGQIAINVSGGVGPFAYSVNGYIKGYTTTRNLTVAGLPAGTYLVEVTDVNGCTTSTNVLINTTGQPALTGITSTNPTCPQQNGTITVPAGGTDVYTVTIAGTATQIGQTSAGATYSVPGGTYLISRTTSSSCVSVTTVVISQPDGLDFNIQYNNPNCLSPASGSLTVIQTTGGTVPPPYSMTVTGASGVVSSTGLSASALPAGSYTVTIGDGNGCTFSNTVTLSNPTSCSADLSIVKTGSTTALAGGPVTYTLVVSNAGPSAANGATVTDPAVANFTATGVSCAGVSGSAVCPVSPTVATLQGAGLVIPTLPSGGSVTLVVTGTAGSSGTITNIASVTPPASVTDTNPANNSSTAVTPITPVADLAITKVGTSTALVGGTVTYTLVVTNSGPSAANGATVTDPSVANLSASSVVCSGASGGAVCPSPTVASLQSGLTIATLPSGGSLTLIVTGTATGTPQITNVASVTTPAGTTDSNPLNNSATAVTGVGTPVADLAIVKIGSTTAVAGGPVTYTLVVTNAGPNAADGATVTDPAVSNFTATGVSCAGASGGAVCPSPTVASLQSGLTIATLPSGGSLTLVVTGTAGTSGTITNIASVTTPAGVTDSNPANNSSTAVTPITPVADLAITKVGTSTAIVGGTVTYTLVVTNSGPSAANGAILTDPAVANLTASSVSCAGASGGAVCPAVSVASLQSGLTIATLPSGGSLTLVVTGTATGTPQITNVASVTTPAGTTDSNPLNNSATAVTGVGTPVADLAIVKTGSTTAVAGGPVTYTLVVTNAGPNAADGATVTDPAVSNFTTTGVSCAGASNGAVCPSPTVASLQSGLTIATLPSGGSLTLVVTGTAGASGTIVNVATVATPPGVTDSNPANNSSTAVTPITPPCQPPVLTVSAAVCSTAVGGTYTATYISSGTVTVTGGTISGNTLTASSASGNMIVTATSAAGCTTSLTIVAPATCPTNCTAVPTLTVGQPVCLGTGSYAVNVSGTNGTITVSAGSLVGNTLTVPIGISVMVTITGATGCGSYSVAVASPASCTPTDCSATPLVSVSGPNCSSNGFYSVNYTAPSGVTVTASAGTVNNGTISNIPVGTVVSLTATNGSCPPQSVTIASPTSCPFCQPPVLTVSAAVCSTAVGGTYTATYVSSGTVTVVGGTISGSVLTANTASGNMVVTSTSGTGCTTSLTVIAPATCPTPGSCTLVPTLTVGQPVCLGTNYQMSVSGQNGTVTASAGTLNGNVLTVPVGTSVVVTITGTTGCGSYSMAVASPASCTPTDCSASPLVSISGPVCAGTGIYSVNYTAPSGVTVTASAGTVGSGVINNIPIGTTVSVTATNGSCPPQSVTIASPTNCNVADLAITKVGTTTATVGGTVTYTLVVTNSGPAAANGAIVTDPAATNFNATGVICSGASGGAVCPSPTVASLQSGLTIATLPSGGSLTLVVTGTASGTAQITNVASVTTPAGIIDSNPLNNSATAVTGVGTPVADLAIVKTGSTTAVAGGPVIYTLVVTNAGPNAADGATVTDPAVVNFTATSVSCAGASGGAVCPSPTVASLQSGLTIATLPSGGSLTLVVTGTAGASGTIVNVATVTTPAGVTDSNPANNSSTAVTPISPACPTPVNRANVALCNTEVLDLATYVPAGGSYTLLTGTAGSLSGSTFNGIVSGVGLFKVGYRASGVSANCAPDTITVIVRNCGALPCNYPVNSIVVDANCGSSDGRAQVTVGGIASGATTSFAWSNGQTGAAITGLAAGVYSFTATIADGANICTVVDSIQVNNIGGPVAELKLVTAANCTTNGAASLSIVSGVGPFTITWTGASSGTLSNVALGPVTISNLPAGAYSFKISSAATPNCFGYLSVNVPRNDVARITLTATPTAATACNSPTGSIQITVTPQAGVTAPFSYSLDGQLIGSSNLPSYTFTNLPAGVYTVAVGSANGCATASVPVRIDQTGAAPITGVSTVNPACPTDVGQIIFAGGQSGTTYQVRDALTGTVISSNISGATASTLVVSAGTYWIQTTSGSCTSSTVVTINRPQDIDINIQYTAETCGSGGVGNGDGSLSAIQITGGTKPYTVVVTNSQGQVISSANFNSLPAGNYTVNVVDANGCTGSQGALVTVPPCSVVCPKLTFSSVVVDAQCGSSNGTATVQLLNPPTGSTVTYLWSNGQNTASISGLASGIYSVTAQISTTGIYSGCRYVDTVHVNAIGGPVFTVSSQTPASCTAANGSAVINLQSGTGPFNVSWTGATSGSQTVPNLGTFTINGLAAGSYTFTVTGAGSTSTCQSLYTITLPGTSGSLSATPTPTNVSSCNASDGQIAVNVSGGVGPFIYTVNGFVQGVTSVRNFNVMGLPAGIYYVQVTDKNGCTTTSSNVLINTTGQPAISGFTGTNATCPEQNGTIAFNGSGVASDQYKVTIAGTATQIGQTAGNVAASYSVPAGTYLITRTTSSSCVSVTTITISQPAGLEYNIQYANPTCAAPNSASLAVIQATGGTAPLSYTVTSATGVVSSLTGLTSGSYTVTLGDANGCTLSKVVSLTTGVNCSICFSAFVYLQGSLVNNIGVWPTSPTTGANGEPLMRDDLRVQNLIPLSDPYRQAPYNATFTHVSNPYNETISAAMLTAKGDSSVVDWVFLEFRDKTNPSVVKYTRSALVLRNGTIIDFDGSRCLHIDHMALGDYYVAVRHRNHLGVMTQTTRTLGIGAPSDVTVDFRKLTPAEIWHDTSDPNQVALYGDVERRDISWAPGYYALWGGNANRDHATIFQGQTNDPIEVYNQTSTATGNFFNNPAYILNGYYSGDVNMNGQTIFQGQNNEPIIIYNIMIQHPKNFLNNPAFIIKEQLP